MKDFKSYSENPPENNTTNGTPEGAANGSATAYNNTVELAKVLTKAMSGKNEGQILRTIISEAERGKREGTLTNADLDNFYNALAPFVDGIKRRKLKEVITRLKGI
ncbi:MAG: hypothetical protein K2O89_00020 [Clostridia bacterium]|nr:hypothetical protein [Clostridia bacterium]